MKNTYNIPSVEENALQRQCVALFNMFYSDTGAILHHSPNNISKLDKVKGMIYNIKMKALGTQKGFPTLMILYQGRTLLIELNTDKSFIRPHQKYLHTKLKSAGFNVQIIGDAENFLKVCKEFIK